MQIRQLDHLVLTVKDLNKTVRFYESVLGMEKVVFGQNRVALKFGNQKINLHQAGMEFDPKAGNTVTGSADLCFLTDLPLEQAMHEITGHEVEIIKGPVERTGANGPIISFYIRDPDQNLIEIANEKHSA
ncbi:VOC family protein [Thiomicrorhabdus sp. ZW0627]|uniref:VOC family protein n=1 Tax=Thiomicrorhabdus sp. ZW0627 TaxID=3039774 RepID=UPI00243744FB|nr:VOC family protein [Thiomicrorhabdus sp. ZW0627]MDG6773174.1 VOC family protein [Thiomicrorhabdus sp. ZW0627]